MIFGRAAVFVGPTIGRDIVLSKIDAEVFGPAQRGDVYRVAREEPRAILLIDGTFENSAAVFHKEILWALSHGIHVLGSSSLGALRAAELQPFGMVGVGEVFQSYHVGQISEDDAVAVLHGPAELGWPQLTRALVDINATLKRAEAEGILSSSDRLTLEQAARSVFWKERTFERVLDHAAATGWEHRDRQSVYSWIVANEVSQKAKDAYQLIEYVASQWEALEEPHKANFQFENTSAWQALKDEVDNSSVAGFRASSLDLDELDKNEGSHEAYALIHTLLREIFNNEAVANDELALAAVESRKIRNLETGQQVLKWLQDTGLGHSDYMELIKGHLFLRKFRARHANSIRAETNRLLRADSPKRSNPEVFIPKDEGDDYSP
jgi:hypothetical protein